jgi:hypothetical protein
MTASLPLLILSTLLLPFFVGCTTKAQPIACFKGSSVCYTQETTTSSNCKECVASFTTLKIKKETITENEDSHIRL